MHGLDPLVRDVRYAARVLRKSPVFAILVVAAMPGVILGVIEIVAGLIAARFGANLLRHLVWGVSVGDPTTFAASGVTVLVVAVIAALVPSLRIVRLNPIKALRA